MRRPADYVVVDTYRDGSWTARGQGFLFAAFLWCVLKAFL